MTALACCRICAPCNFSLSLTSCLIFMCRDLLVQSSFSSCAVCVRTPAHSWDNWIFGSCGRWTWEEGEDASSEDESPRALRNQSKCGMIQEGEGHWPNSSENLQKARYLWARLRFTHVITRESRGKWNLRQSDLISVTGIGSEQGGKTALKVGWHRSDEWWLWRSQSPSPPDASAREISSAGAKKKFFRRGESVLFF